MRLAVTLLSFIAVILFTVCDRSPLYDSSNPDPLASYSLSTIAKVGAVATYIFESGTINGALGPRANVNGICQATQVANYPGLNGMSVVALISMGAGDSLANLLPAPFHSKPVAGIKPGPVFTTIAADWPTLMSGTLINPLSVATSVPGSYWWTGSDSSGIYNPAWNCLGWTDNTGAQSSIGGDTGAVNANWVSSGTILCSTGIALMCLAY